jgi:hypothetical protein
VRTFVWAEDLESEELKDGVFDMERWARYFKSSVVRGKN